MTRYCTRTSRRNDLAPSSCAPCCECFPGNNRLPSDAMMTSRLRFFPYTRDPGSPPRVVITISPAAIVPVHRDDWSGLAIGLVGGATVARLLDTLSEVRTRVRRSSEFTSCVLTRARGIIAGMGAKATHPLETAKPAPFAWRRRAGSAKEVTRMEVRQCCARSSSWCCDTPCLTELRPGEGVKT